MVYLYMFIVPGCQMVAGNFSKTPARYPDYSTFPPTYSLNLPSGSLGKPVLSTPLPIPELPIPRLNWGTTSSTHSATQPLPWLLSTYPIIPSLGSHFAAASYSYHPRLRYRTLSSSISNGSPLPPSSSSHLLPFGTRAIDPLLPPGTAQSEFD